MASETPVVSAVPEDPRFGKLMELMTNAVWALRALNEYEEHAIFCDRGCKGRMFVEQGCLEGLRLRSETNRLRHRALKQAEDLGLVRPSPQRVQA